jgi:uncharacterized protein (TIGR01777 family)
MSEQEITRVLVTGATGMIGQVVCRALAERGDQVVAVSRDQERAQELLGTGVEVHGWADPTRTPPPGAAVSNAGAVIHLLGDPVAQRWSAEAKERIRDSRVLGTRMLVEGLRALPPSERPAVLVSQSAAGFYGPSDARELDEQAPAGDDFLAGVVRDWEAEAQGADDLLRVVMTRSGLVLSPSGGALARMLPFFKAGIGGPVAGGKQYVPWIHLGDVVAALLFCVDRTGLRGAVNVTAPAPVTNAELSRALGHVLHRPAFMPVPGFVLRILYGEMAGIITTGQRAVPRQLLEEGFSFQHPALEAALADVL